jgi:hypothetical protein
MSLSSNKLSWNIEISLINNRFILSNVLKGIAITLGILLAVFGTIFSFQQGFQGIMSALVPCLGLGAFFLIVSVLTLGVILQNKYPLEFIINEGGIIMKSQSGTAKKVHRLALILGILARSTAVAGAGAAGMAGEEFTCSWKEIKSVKLYPAQRVVAAKQNFIQTMYVFCTEKNFKEVSELVLEKASKKK